jgi:hypothetical protein
MSQARPRIAAAIAFTAGAIAVGVGAMTQQDQASAPPRPESRGKEASKPERPDSVRFQRIGLSADDLAEVTGLNIYKFRADLAKGQRFRVVLSVRPDEKSLARESAGIPFQARGMSPQPFA